MWYHLSIRPTQFNKYAQNRFAKIVIKTENSSSDEEKYKMLHSLLYLDANNLDFVHFSLKFFANKWEYAEKTEYLCG